MTNQQIEKKHNYRTSYNHVTSCSQCEFFSSTPHHYRSGITFLNCRKLTSAGYTKAPHPDHTCDDFTPNHTHTTTTQG